MKPYHFVIFSFIILLSISTVSAQTYSSFIKLVGVDNEGKGVVGNVTVEVQPGKGRVLVDTEPLQGIDLQHSERTAVKVAEDVTGFNFSSYDVIYTIRTPNAHIVEGPSAGGALTLATIAAVEEKSISQAFAMTGTIQEDHSIGPVGAILAKAKAAADSGVTLFLIPKGQAIQNQYVKKVERPAPGWYIETVEPVPVNVIDYAKENWGLTIHEVSNIEEAMKYAFGSIPVKNVTKQPEENVSLPIFTTSLRSYSQFSSLIDDEVSRAKKSYETAKNKLESSSLSSDTKSALNSLLEKSKSYLNESKSAREMGYEYTSGNFAFKSLINSETVIDLVDYYSREDKNLMLQHELAQAKEDLSQAKEEVISKTSQAICDPEKFEWAVGARERITYAENKLDSISLSSLPMTINGITIGGNDPIKIFTYLNVAREWIKISKNFASQVSGTGSSNCLSRFEDDAKKAITDAEKEVSVSKSLGIRASTDAEWYLEAAQKEFSEGFYITAIYDAESAKIRASMGSKYEGKEVNEIYTNFKQESFEPKSLMSAIYLEHSTYQMYKALEDNSKNDATEAIELLELSKTYNKDYENIRGKLSGIPSVSWSFNLSFSENLIVVILVAAVVLIGVYTLSLRLRLRKLEKTGKRVKPKKKLERVEEEMKRLLERKLKERLKKRRITKEEYKKLKKKLKL